ncbi:xanthine dehydrogenase accessory protein XdhC [Pseudohaliea rubra]|uniref:XdhC protein (Assists in molybdopterin insertion into xanthine dehydrogenase) n=1 Tax=Pseudohaliea rubra DSM 19751 TaxID=1265313 RepID=A0A095VRI0_9GAMM|nr:xanthine dehydrogenase accessory protein XdhC [Pseudohaliea rubra]KGE03678.1 XdhC protein (assists in molybdopterin insertion into xanthine dehydrogenase) [Pseudohaliea rubra DSM 19751]
MALHGGSWATAAAERERCGDAYVLATVLSTAGSTPREAGAKMVITGEDTWASIGGGQLEFLVIQRARALLSAGATVQRVEGMPLGAEARQCCGGSVSVLFEVIRPGVGDVVVFGAGHVARALVPLLAELAFRVRWVDNRPELLASPPVGVHGECLADPVAAVPTLPDGAEVLVLTHDHELDYRLVHALLNDFRWRRVGLIGSHTKAERFRTRLARDGLAPALIERLECPVGLTSIPGKRPMAVAIAIAAGLLQRSGEADEETGEALDWRQLRRLLEHATE